jgi:hypothetical protein
MNEFKFFFNNIGHDPHSGADASVECVFVGLGDELKHCSFCGFVSLSFPESANPWDRWKEPPSGTGSSRWRDPAVPVLAAGLAQRYGPLVGLSRPSGQAHIPMQCLSFNSHL